VSSQPELGPLAFWVASNAPQNFDSALRERLYATILDWSSALIAGTNHSLFPSYLKGLSRLGEVGPVHIAGASGTYPLAVGASVNAAISHLWEVDDAHRTSTSHPGITIIPAVMAIAESRNISTERFAGAIVAGFEVVLRIGSHLGPDHYARCHTTATAGTFGAAAAIAHAIELNEADTLSAFGHAGTQAAGLWQFLDDKTIDAKAFHAATAVRNGISAALMAEAGIAGAPHILEGPRGMRAAWGLKGCDPSWLLPTAKPMIHDVTIKGWPVCGQMHSALDCARAIANDYSAPLTDIEHVLVELPRSALEIAGAREPTNVSHAKFSTSFCIAAVLSKNSPDFRGLRQSLVDNQKIAELAERVHVLEEPSFTARFPNERPARVTLYPKNGPPIIEERAFRGGDPEAPWSRPQLRQRTLDILTLSDGSWDAEALFSWCLSFSNIEAEWQASKLFSLT